MMNKEYEYTDQEVEKAKDYLEGIVKECEEEIKDDTESTYAKDVIMTINHFKVLINLAYDKVDPTRGRGE